MKIYILFFLLFSSFYPFSSSPVMKKQLDAYNDPGVKLESSIKAIIPQVDDYFLKMHHPAETIDKKSAATSKSTENNEPIAGTYTISNGKNNVKHLDNATGNRHEDGLKKAKTGGKSRDAFSDAVLKMKFSMYDYFSMMRHVLKKLEEKRDEKSGFTSTSNENKEHIADGHLSSNVKNNSKHLNNTTNVLHQDDPSKGETKGRSFDAYNDAIHEIESFRNVIMPQIDDYFSNMHTILKIQPEERDEKSVVTSKLIKNKEHTGEVYTSPNVLNDKKSLDNAPNNQHEIGLTELKANERSLDDYNNTIVKEQASIKARMPQKDDYFLKRHYILKWHVGEGEEKSGTTSKSTEKKQHIVKAYTSSNAMKDDKNLGKAIDDRRENEINYAKTNGKSVENPLDQDLEHHVQVPLSNGIASGNGKFVTNSTGRNSNTTIAISNANNDQSSNRKSSKVNFSQKEILNSGNENAILKNKQLRESSNKIDYQLTQENRSVLSNLSPNKSSSVSDNSGNEFSQNQYSEELETKKSGTNTKSLKNSHEINDGNVVTASMNSKAELTNPKESSHMTNKIHISTEGVFKNYQKNLVRKTDKTTPITRLVDENEINIMRSEKSHTGDHVIKQENSDGNISSLTSTIAHAKQNEKSPTKETGESLQKIEVRQKDKQMNKNKIMNHSTSTSKLDDSDAKSPKADKKTS